MLAEARYLKSGDCITSRTGETILTDLGSCIAVCIYDVVKKQGGAIHYLLPDSSCRSESAGPSRELDSGDKAVVHLLKQMKVLGSERRNLEAYIIGGCLKDADQEPTPGGSDYVARLNREIAVRELKTFGVRIKKERTGVQAPGIRLRFDTGTGELQICPIKKKVALSTKQVKIRVLIVDDSAAIQKVLRAGLSKFEELEVVGCASDAFEAERLRKKLNPDAMTLDVQMPGKDGITYLRELRRTSVIPVIMVSDLSPTDAKPILEALEVGAFDFVHKPAFNEMEEKTHYLKELLVAAVKSKRRKRLDLPQQKRVTAPRCVAIAASSSSLFKLIAIGASTGGTEALRVVFAQFPEQTPPIVVVQHMPPVFTYAFAEGLNRISKINVREGSHREVLKPNTAYIAPGGKQMRVIEGQGKELLLDITDEPPVNRFKPSVDYLFNSIANLGIAKKTRAALLTGMGDDGARGLLCLKDAGAHTIAQDEETCVVFGMPKAAIEKGAAMSVVPIDEVASELFLIDRRLSA